MFTPHYIRLHPKNYSEIQDHVSTTKSVLDENYKDSLDEKTPYYVYVYRHPVIHTIRYFVCSEAELKELLKDDTLRPKAESTFVKA